MILSHSLTILLIGLSMLTTLQWIYLLIILITPFIGGYVPFAKPDQVRASGGFPRGEAFSSGVFLALSLMMFLPASDHLFGLQLPELNYPLSSIIAIIAFLGLLAMEHMTTHAIESQQIKLQQGHLPARIPLVMTTVIAFPSFFLGTTLGMSDNAAATLIFIAIILHKGTAGFALMLTMVRSTLTRTQTVILFSLFAITTPLGILAGGIVHQDFANSTALIKAIVLSLGAGTFLYLGTLHEMKHASLIEHCGKRNCFLIMLSGLVITALVRFLVGEALHI